MIRKLTNSTWAFYIILLCFGCEQSISVDFKKNEVKTFNILFSTGSYLQLAEDYDKSTNSKMTVEIHRFELKDSALFYQNGIGYNDGLSINMETVRFEKETFVDRTMLYKIGLFAENLLEYKSYESNIYISDCWIVNINVNEKSFRLYSGENEHSGFYRDFHILRAIFYKLIIDAGYTPE